MNNSSKTIMNAIGVMLALIALPAIMTACRPSGKMTQTKMIRVAEKALTEKYGEPFVVTNVSNNNRRKSCFNCEAYSEARDIYFFAQVEDDGSYVGDSYLEKIMGGKIAEVMNDNIGDMDGEHYIYVSDLSEGMGLADTSISIADYVEYNTANQFTVSFFYAPSGAIDYDRLYDVLSNKLFKDLHMLRGVVVLHILDKQNLDNIEDYIKTHASYEQDEYRQFLQDEKSINIQYEYGILDIGREAFTAGLADKGTGPQQVQDNDRKDEENANRAIIALALGIEDETSRAVTHIAYFLKMNNAGKIRKAVMTDGDILEITAENGTEYQLYLSPNKSIDAVKNKATGEWLAKSYR